MAPKSRALSSDLRNMTVKCYKENQNQSELARMLEIPRSTLNIVIQKFEKYGSKWEG